MTSDYLFVGVGALVWLFGIVLVAWHVRQRRKTMGDPGLPPDEQRFLDQQYRRRMQTSALTITLGALIALCDYLTFLKTSPGYAATYVTVLLLLAMWLVLLAVGDAMASRIHMGRSLRKNRKSREALAGALAELRRHEEQELRRRDDDLMSASNDRK
jgi:peptidoglycan/LPS O-acetylase OafA/YrhL